jgi:hypothetical protein
VPEDLRSHYELAYTPANSVYDGSFRRVEVKVRRSGLITRSREGYYAFRSTDVAESPFELPLVAALNNETSPRDFTILNSTMVFPTGGVKSEALFYNEIPLSEFSFPLDSRKKEYAAKVQVLVVVKNEGGHVIEKFSQEFQLKGPVVKTEETRNRHFLFYRSAMLNPGRYRIETVVRDPLGAKSSVKRAILAVPRHAPGSLDISSIVLVKRLDDSRLEANLADNPLVLGTQMVVPYLEPAIHLKEALQLAFYLVVAAPTGRDTTLDTILFKDGNPLGHTGEKPLPAPDSRGLIRCVTTLPVAELTEGSYDVQVTVRQGNTAANGRAVFTIQ